jgi:protein arginine kinase
MSARTDTVRELSRGVPAWFDNSGPQSDVVISTRVRLARNLANHQFPGKSSASEKRSVFERVASVFDDSSKLRGTFSIINFAQLPRLQQQYLVEERIASPDMLSIDGDRGVISDRTRRINILINEEDHLRLQCLDSGFRPQETWGVLDMLDDNLGQKLPFSFDSRRGFLTCCPTNSGTGLRVSFLMHLPGLILTKVIDATLQGASQMGISTRGFFGEHSDVVGNFFQLSNQATMGAHESEFLDSTQKVIREVAICERKARERILRDARLEITDKVFRSWGILLHACTLTVTEYLNLASALRLGIECGIFDKITIPELNRITMLVMPAHLQLFNKTELDETQIGVARADMVRKLLQKKKTKNGLREKNREPDDGSSSGRKN